MNKLIKNIQGGIRMARKGISYFAEQRGRNNNPNFYVSMRDEDLRRQVKRIVRDMRNSNIEEQDYVYFKNDKIISACITESYEQWKSAETIRNALTYYFNVPLSNGTLLYPNINLWEERSIVSNELGKVTNKATLWNIAYRIFIDISNGADIGASISNLYKIDSRIFYDL